MHNKMLNSLNILENLIIITILLLSFNLLFPFLQNSFLNYAELSEHPPFFDKHKLQTYSKMIDIDKTFATYNEGHNPLSNIDQKSNKKLSKKEIESVKDSCHKKGGYVIQFGRKCVIQGAPNTNWINANSFCNSLNMELPNRAKTSMALRAMITNNILNLKSVYFLTSSEFQKNPSKIHVIYVHKTNMVYDVGVVAEKSLKKNSLYFLCLGDIE